MPLPKSNEAYADVEAHFERALASPRGIAITVASPGTATQLAQKFNAFRERLRKQSRKVYPPEDPRYGRSTYDALQVRKDPENDCRVLIQRYEIKTISVEEL